MARKYYVGNLVGLNDEFQIMRWGTVASISYAEKNDYGQYIFTRVPKALGGGLREVITGKKFGYIIEYPDIYDCDYIVRGPVSGLMVDPETIKEIPKSVLKEKLAKYTANVDKKEATKDLTNIQENCNHYLLKALDNVKNFSNKSNRTKKQGL